VRLSPRDDSFFEMFTASASNLAEAAKVLTEFVDNIDRRQELAEKLTDLEHVGDDITSKIVKRLNTSFVTPFDHEDIYSLAVSLDDVADLIDAGSDHVVLYELGELPKGIHKQVAIIAELAEMTNEAMPRLRKVSELSDYWTKAKSIESDADRIHRRLLAKLFSGQYKALEVMKLKEVVDDLEDAINAFERVAKTVEAIAVKES
jgi:predicted phosphate transport protein (TIGR00153 family)